ncbi:MAG: hypothetical protein GX541_07575 [Clostridiales bacterium]|nr:hypothetical protein [Clostridiales bacterium]
MNFSLERIERMKIKALAWKTLRKNWVSSAFLVMLVYIAQLLGLNFMPFITEKKIIAFSQVLDSYYTKLMQTEYKLLVSAFKEMLINLWSVMFPAAPTTNQILLLIITVLLLLLLGSPISIGLYRFFGQVSRGKKPKVLVALSDYINLRAISLCVGFNVLLGIRYILWFAVACAVPAGLAAAAIYFGSAELFSLSIPAFLLALVLYYIKTGAYICAGYIFSENIEAGASAAIRESVRLTRGKLLRCAAYRISFFVWELMSFLANPIVFIYKPFYMTATAFFTGLLRGGTVTEPARETQSAL